MSVQTYLLKMARSGEDGEKLFILLESGMRFHTTQVLPLNCCNGAGGTEVSAKHQKC